MNINIQPDLVVVIHQMVELNGLSADGYVNGLIEKGLYRDLEETHTKESVRLFMNSVLGLNPDWNLLVSNEQ